MPIPPQPPRRRDVLKLIARAAGVVAAAPLLQACASAIPRAANPAPQETPAEVLVAATAEPTAPPTTTPAPSPTVTPTQTPTPSPSPTVSPTPSPSEPTATPTPTDTLQMWWWGEQEAPGLQSWLAQSAALFQRQNGVAIQPTLQDTSLVVSQFQTASAAQAAPDLQFFWSGLYQLESVWLDYVAPLDGLVPAEVLAAANPGELGRFQGQQWRLGWYAVPMLWLYNKEHFGNAGLDPDLPPPTFEKLLDACKQLKAKSIVPIVAGAKDGFWGEWQFAHGLTPYLDSPADLLNLFAGSGDWRDTRFAEHWGRTASLARAGYFNQDVLALTLREGMDLFASGQGAMCATFGPAALKLAQTLGPEKVGTMRFPSGGSGRMAGRPIVDVQGLGIGAQSVHQQQAADFLTFLNGAERLQALFDETHWLPANQSWDGTRLPKGLLGRIWTDWVKVPNRVPYLGTVLPTYFWTEALVFITQKLLSGQYDAAAAAAQAKSVSDLWRDAHPELAEKYGQWAAEFPT